MQRQAQVNRNPGRWTKQEHQKFICGIQKFGKDWKKIQAFIGTRNGAQIRSHAQKFYIKMKKQTQINQNYENWEQTKETPPEHTKLPTTFVSEQVKQSSIYDSYFPSKIIKIHVIQNGSFNFWNSLIDQPSIIPARQQQKLLQNSFLAISSSSNEILSNISMSQVKFN